MSTHHTRAPISFEKETAQLPYGDQNLKVLLPAGCQIDWIAPQPMPRCPAVEKTLLHQLGTLPDTLLTLVTHARRVGIVINDLTRPAVQRILAPPLAKWLKNINRHISITFYIANGLHPPHAADLLHLLPVALTQEAEIVNHDAENSSELIRCGKSSRGTPIVINARFLQEDVRIVIGVVEPHQFVGYTGGAKGVAIGLAGRETISANHALLHAPQAGLGQLEDNPVRADLEEIGQQITLHLCVNSILNSEGEIAGIFCGSSEIATRAAVDALIAYRGCYFDKRYDLVVASAGGWPRDINLYQAQKALAHVAPLAMPTAPIVLIAQCRAGVGDTQFEHWYSSCTSAHDAIQRFQEEPFVIGPHKGYLWARDMLERTVYLYSDLPHKKVSSLHLRPVSSIENILQQHAIPNMRIALVPHATMTIVRRTKG